MRRAGTIFFSFLVGILIGFAGTLGAIAGVGYYAYTKLNIKQVEQLTGMDISILDGIFGADSQLEYMSVQQLIGKIGAIPAMSLNELTAEYNITLPEGITFLTNALGSIPIYSIPGSAIGVLMTEVKIAELLGAPYNDYETYPLVEGAETPEDVDKFMWEIRGYTVSGEQGVSGYIDTINVGTLRTVFGVALPDFMDAISDETRLSELGEEINGIEIRSLITNPKAAEDYDTTQFVVADNIIDAIHRSKDAEDKPYTLQNMSGLFGGLTQELTVNDLIKAPEEGSDALSDKIMSKILATGANIEELGGKIGEVMQGLEMRDVLTAPTGNDVDTPTGRLIGKLIGAKPKDDPADPDTYYKITEMNIVIGTLNRGDLFPGDTGFMSLIPAVTPLNELDDAMADSFKNKTIGDLAEAGLITLPPDYPDDRKEWTIDQLVQFSATPIGG